MTVRDVFSLLFCCPRSWLFVCLCVCLWVFLSTVIFSMALSHKIFTLPSIMDCDLIEAECSHHAPSVNSPHEHQVLKKPNLASFRSAKKTEAQLKAVLFHTFFFTSKIALCILFCSWHIFSTENISVSFCQVVQMFTHIHPITIVFFYIILQNVWALSHSCVQSFKSAQTRPLAFPPTKSHMEFVAHVNHIFLFKRNR